MTTELRTMSRAQSIVRHRSVAETQGVLAIVGGAFVLTVAITLLASIFVDVRISGWDLPAGLSRWYAGGVGVYLTAVFLPLYVAHGRTRREFLAAAPVVVAVVAVLLSATVTLGYVLESVLYGVAGWPQGLTGWSEPLVSEIDASVTTFVTIGSRHLLLMTVWLVGGALAGAAFYRQTSLGLATIPLLLVVAGVTEAAVGGGTLPQLVRAADAVGIGEVGSLMSAVTISGLCVALCGALTWALARDQPLRTHDR